jgi:uncharacterized pyridoxamine 5'-phosphate oxidase family protein
METIDNIIQDWKNRVIDFNLFKKKLSTHLDIKDDVLVLIDENYISLNDVSERLKNDRDVVLKAISKHGDNILFANKKFLADKVVVLAAMKKTGERCNHIFEKISTALKNDDELVNMTLKNSPECLIHLTEKYSDNKELLLKLKVSMLEGYSDRLKNDHDVVLMTVKRNGFNLKHASKELQDNYDIVLAAVNKNGKALEFASSRLRSDKRIVKKAINNDPMAVYYMSEDARDNKSIILYILKKDGQYFHLASDKLKRDFEVIRTALLHTVEGFVIPFLCPDILEHMGYGDALYNFMPKHKKK